MFLVAAHARIYWFAAVFDPQKRDFFRVLTLFFLALPSDASALLAQAPL